MGDLTRTQQSQPVQITDDSTQLVALSTGPAGTEVGLVVRNVPFGTQTVAGTVTVVPSGTQTVAGTVTVTPLSGVSSTNTLSQVTVSNGISTQLLASNAARKTALFYNGGTNYVYIKFGATASATSFTVILQPNGLFELPLPTYTGQIDALANNASVVINVTEL